ncbi:solute carrier family 13 member 5-like isoform X1 [Asterias rubens]|uniref:solute carrier family 13 member 5-like isoform X1 n=2 Tax=Asterias rubens TaxID=7604 RepID=UPI0014551CBD|nr:solute carrier family 13 member 5-like isoform X1 [Asterias rubens]
MDANYSPIKEMADISEAPPPPHWGINGGSRPTDDRPPHTESRLALALRNRRYFIVVLTPLILCPIPIIISNPIGYTAYSIMIMAVFWCTEAISIAITALLPLVLFPLFGVMSAKVVSVQYLKDTNFLFFGGLLVALAIENCNLHRRIALAVLVLVGSKPRWMMFGFMLITAFLSMWISNTATTAMMLPIAQAVLDQVKADNLQMEDEDGEAGEEHARNGSRVEEKSDALEMEKIEVEKGSVNRLTSTTKSSLIEDKSARYDLMCKGIILCVPYAANIGGTATLTGTAPNLVLAGQVQSLFGSEAEISFGEWIIYATPGMLICLLFTWIWLQIFYIDRWCCTTTGDEIDHKNASKVIRKEYNNLGPMSFAEKGVLVHFILLIALWITRKPGFVTGWSVLFEDGYVSDATTAMLISLMLCMFPSRMPKFMCGHSTEEDEKEQKGPCPALLEWKIINEKMAWLVIILLGGGFALAEACKVSGLSEWIGDQFIVLDVLPPYAIALVVSVIIAAFTEVTSNTATATIFLPILGSLGESIGINPLLLMIPATVACSFAFMLPVATPPNAIAFANGQISVMDMVKTGFVLNVICVLVANASVNTLGVLIFDVGNVPPWLNTTDASM